MEIPLKGLGNTFSAEIDDSDAALVEGYPWAVMKDDRNFYAVARVKRDDGRRAVVLMHRLILPGVREVDHKDGNGLNNTRNNLRASTHSQNIANAKLRCDCSSGFRGVTFDIVYRRPWRAQICKDGRITRLGGFATPEEAALAYNNAAVELHGEFARLNVIQPAAMRKPAGRAQYSLPFNESEVAA
jgi:hypothetical protein